MRLVEVHSPSKTFMQEVAIGPHRFISDVGAKEGGTDQGPNPHEYLCTALATCTAITLKMYATRKLWDLQDSKISVTITEEGAVTAFLRTIELVGNLDIVQKQRLLEIANICPVHKLLTSQIKINSVLI